MTIIQAPRESPLDKAAVLVAGSMIVGTYALVFRLLEGSWLGILRHLLTVAVALLVYFGALAGAAFLAQHQGRSARGAWFLFLAPAFGVTAGLAAAWVDDAAGGLPASSGNGFIWGVLHALYLRWWWRRQVRESHGRQGGTPTRQSLPPRELQ